MSILGLPSPVTVTIALSIQVLLDFVWSAEVKSLAQGNRVIILVCHIILYKTFRVFATRNDSLQGSRITFLLVELVIPTFSVVQTQHNFFDLFGFNK